MRCLTEGELRAFIDLQGEDPAAAQAHLADCPACRAAADELRGNAELAAAAVGTLRPERPPAAAQIRAARGRLGAAMAPSPARRHDEAERPGAAAAADRQDEHARPPAAAASDRLARPGSWRRPAWLPTTRGRLAAAALVLVVAAGVVATPAGRSAASGFLAQFRSQRFAVVTFDPNQAEDSAAALQQLGTVSGDLGGLPSSQVASLAEASRRVGFAVSLPDPGALPSGVAREPRIQVSPTRQVRFTLQAAKVRDYLRAHGRADAAVPQGLDGATLVVNVPAAALLAYPAADGTPGLLVGQASEVTATVEGATSVERLRAFLLDLPGLPPQTVRQLRAIGDWRNTLPLPVPADLIGWRTARIAGSDGLLLSDRRGLGAAAIWQRDGRIYGVAGMLRQAEVLRVAETLG
jgi:hypothetical protein